MDRLSQVLGHLKASLDEGTVDDHLCGNIRELGLSPGLDLLLHAGKVPLHLVHADRQRVLQ
jgi:hypothetical protein